WGFIDKSREFVIKPKFDYVWSFSEGLAKVELNGKWGFIDKNGEFAIEPKFDDIGY
uniref:WG repeat-containing protein n=1 Tax=Campylobacter coli TaxID=195 RepID=UPI001BFF2505